MEFKSQDVNYGYGDAPNNPEKEIPAKPDRNPDPTKPRPGGNEPGKNDPTRIQEPPKTDPTRIANPMQSRGHKMTRVNSWGEALEKIQAMSIQ